MMISNKIFLAATAILVFLLGLTASYLLLGNKFPWAGKIWHQLVKIFPIPVATVAGYDVKNDLVEAARRLGLQNPVEFAIQATAVKVLADRERLALTDSEIQAKERFLQAGWQNETLSEALKSRKVSISDFRKLFIEPDLYKEKLAAAHQVRTAKVDEVYNKLSAGEDFSKIASLYSEDQLTKTFGGDTGFITEGQVYSGLWPLALRLNAGAWDGPLATPDGYVFIKKIGQRSPVELHLQVILIKTFDFDSWFAEQVKKMRVVVYI